VEGPTGHPQLRLYVWFGIRPKFEKAFQLISKLCLTYLQRSSSTNVTGKIESYHFEFILHFHVQPSLTHFDNQVLTKERRAESWRSWRSWQGCRPGSPTNGICLYPSVAFAHFSSYLLDLSTMRPVTATCVKAETLVFSTTPDPAAY
jgi:hypothetical protein